MFQRYGRTGLVLFGAALYGGPVLAGLAGHGWAVLPVFATLFLLHVSATRKPDLSTGAGWAGLAIMIALQIALVTAAWGTGLVLSALFGAIWLPLWAPLAVTALAAGIGAWAYRDAAEMDVMLDSAIRALETLDPGTGLSEHVDWPEPSPEVQAALDEALEAVRRLDEASANSIDPIVQRLETATGADAFDPFYDAAGQEGGDNEPAVDFALLRYVASPAVLTRLIDRGEAGMAPLILLDAPDASVRAQARARVVELVDAGASPDQLPDPDWLADLARRFPGEGFELLAASCRRA